jgi:cytochrome c peroxidase
MALAVSTSAMAKITTIKGCTNCAACHVGVPVKKKFNPLAARMVAKYKEPMCKACHGWADGKLTTKAMKTKKK